MTPSPQTMLELADRIEKFGVHVLLARDELKLIIGALRSSNEAARSGEAVAWMVIERESIILFSKRENAESFANRTKNAARPLYAAPNASAVRGALRPFAEWANRDRSAVLPGPVDELIRLARKACDDYAALASHQITSDIMARYSRSLDVAELTNNIRKAIENAAPPSPIGLEQIARAAIGVLENRIGGITDKRDATEAGYEIATAILALIHAGSKGK